MAFLTKSLPRRTVLKGIGTTLALPFLDAMLPPMRAAANPTATASKPSTCPTGWPWSIGLPRAKAPLSS